jgi:Tol biopolymer transport system component
MTATRVQTLSAQPVPYNHPELDWRSVETEHFFVHFHQGEERTARLTAEIAERVYDPVVSLYGYRPDTKIHFIIRDYEDDSNGASFYYDNKIELWASAMDFALRGTHDWLTNVVTHEFTHMISLGAARKGTRQVPAVYLQWFGFEPEKRPDVLHGYPNRIVSYPIAGTVMPMWFAESVAQFQRAGLDYDTWDTHRDMLLRTAAIDGGLLSLTEMSIFGKNSIGNERVYNQGYGLTVYIAHRYGEQALRGLARAMKAPLRMGFNGAVEKVLNRSEKDLYGEWVKWISEGYERGTESIRSRPTVGRILESEGCANFTPVWSPDGKQIAYVSSRGRDYLSQTSLWLHDAASRKNRRIAADVAPGISWSPDGKRIVYSRRERTRNGSNFFDCYVYDAVRKKETRITHALRFRQPDWSPDGKTIAGVIEKDGTCNLVLIGIDGKRSRPVTAFSNGEQIFDPKWMGPEGKIVFSLSGEREDRDIAIVDTSGGGPSYLVRTSRDERDPFPGPDGKSLYYASDSTGIFNVYKMDLESGENKPVTNVIGGAFSPSVNGRGELAYSLFQSDGFKIAVLDSQSVSLPLSAYVSPYDSVWKAVSLSGGESAPIDSFSASAFSPKPYKPIFSKFAFMPRLMVDYPNKPKFGTYFYGSDVLDQVSLFGSGALNARWDTDAFVIFEYKKLYPTLFFEGYHMTRHSSIRKYDFRNTFMEADLGADWPLGASHGLRTAFQTSRYDQAVFLNTEAGRIKGTPYTYDKENQFQVRWTYRAVHRTVYDIAPVRGRQIVFETNAASNQFMTDFVVNSNSGLPMEEYRTYRYLRFFLDWTEYVPAFFRAHSFALRFQAGAIDRPVDDFYDFFAGGLEGMKGYSYYSLEGRKMLRLGLAYRFPIWRKMGLRVLWMNWDNLFGVLYGDAGNAWNENRLDLSEFKRDVGVQMRLGFFSFYSFPTCLFLDAAYGLDKFDMQTGQPAGREWRMYFGILFDFID